MNNEELIDVKTLRPFRRFIYTIGALPSSYLMSMTYEEQLLWFCNYLEKTVIPTIDNNGLAVEELQAKYIELKNYVDEYFDNLDVQEEINNKLDEMAESGELTDIIAQYLQLAGVLVFDTLDDLIEADNLVNGSSVRTLGHDFINDGNGKYYKITNVSSANSIAINNDLYADEVSESKFPNFFLSIYFENESPWKDTMFVSLDGVNHTKLKTPFELQGRDVSLRFNKTNNTFYITTGALDLTNNDFTIYYTTDFITWSYKEINIGLEGNLKWAPDLFIEDDGTMYVVIANNYGTETDIAGETVNAFDLYIAECSNLDTLTFSEGTKLILNGATNRNHIDGSIMKLNNTYYLVAKDEKTKLCEIYSSVDLVNYYIQNENVTGSTLWLEGCQLLQVENDIYFIAEAYARDRHVISKTPVDTFPVFNKFKSIETLQGYKHGSMVYMNNEYAKNLVRSACGEFAFTNNEELEVKVFNRLNISNGTDDFIKDGLAILPNAVYYASGSGTVTLDIVNPFDVETMKFYFAGNNSLKLVINSINGITLSPSFTITNSRFLNEKLIEIPLKYYPLKYMSGTIEELTTSDITMNRPNDFSWNWFHAYKVNGIVNITMSIKCLTSTYTGGVWFDFTTLPVGWRPGDQMSFTNNNPAQGCRITIASNGVVNSYIQLNENLNNAFSISYIAIN